MCVNKFKKWGGCVHKCWISNLPPVSCNHSMPRHPQVPV